MSRVLVPLIGVPFDEAALTAAFGVGARLNCLVEGFHVKPYLAYVSPVVGDALALGVSANLSEAAAASVEAQAAAAEEMFAGAAKAAGADILTEGAAPGFSARYRVAEGRPEALIAERARLSDVVVFDASGLKNAVTLSDAFADTLLHERRPVLLASAGGAYKSGRPAVIAWDGSAEVAAAAVSAAPFLPYADKIIVAQIEDALRTKDAAHADCEEMLDYLSAHGHEAEVVKLTKGADAASDALANFVKETGAGLLVMGAYGRSRLRESLFGGVTADIIADPPAALLLAH